MATKVWIQLVATSPNQCIWPLKCSLHRKCYMNMVFCIWDSLSIHQHDSLLLSCILYSWKIFKRFMPWTQLNAMQWNCSLQFQIRVWALLSALAGMMEQVHMWWTSLLWRGFISYSHKYNTQILTDSMLMHFDHITCYKFVFQSHSAR
jgi:hypothetical protein